MKEKQREIADFIKDYMKIDGKATIYGCEIFTDKAPIDDINQLKEFFKNK